MEPLESTLMDELLRDFSGDMLPPTPPSQRRRRAAEAPPPPSCPSERRSPGPPAAPIMHPSLLDGPAAGSALEPFPVEYPPVSTACGNPRGCPRCLFSFCTFFFPFFAGKTPFLFVFGCLPLPFPWQAFVEEDLEWLSNKDAFPTLDTFDISACPKPSPPPAANPKRPSPVSVLDGVLLAAAAPSLRWATGRPRSKGRRRRRRPLQVFRPPEEPPASPRERRRCWHCEVEETPQWRAGPNGPKTLCNACGVRYKSGRLLPEYRPANSPTFSSRLHSNSHRKVMEMRRKKEVSVLPAPAASATMTKKKGLLAEWPSRVLKGFIEELWRCLIETWSGNFQVCSEAKCGWQDSL
ncbi:hypothetical protein Taro_003643 [Colocasia esculenta]|uniref:GATA-type domain-containing protein n=1 Tax=Colocasia esculenta TaxID=4460 RepID=A0A843TML9_COLES|nr:hypothetical protein [Colocasia esculenta]